MPSVMGDTDSSQADGSSATMADLTGRADMTTGAALHDNNDASEKVTTQYGRR